MPRNPPLKGRKQRLDAGGYSGPSASQTAGRVLEDVGEATPDEMREWLLGHRYSAIPDAMDLGRVLRRRTDWFVKGERPGTWRLRD